MEKKLLNLGRKPSNAHFLWSGSTDYTQICMIENVDMTKVDAVFVTLNLLFKVALEIKVKFRLKLIKCALPSERVSGYYLNLDEINI